MIHFVGAGSGAPDLITVRGWKLLKEADVIIYAGSLVNPALLDDRKEDCQVHDSARMTLEEVLAVMEQASPELVSDVSENGITITGGCGQLWGMDLLLMERTGIACILADDPDSCTAYGAGKSLAWINNMQEGPINIARKRAMRGQV